MSAVMVVGLRPVPVASVGSVGFVGSVGSVSAAAYVWAEEEEEAPCRTPVWEVPAFHLQASPRTRFMPTWTMGKGRGCERGQEGGAHLAWLGWHLAW